MTEPKGEGAIEEALNIALRDAIEEYCALCFGPIWHGATDIGTIGGVRAHKGCIEDHEVAEAKESER